MTKKNKILFDGLYELALKIATRKKPDLARALTLLTEAHDKGDCRATYALATWYLFGNEAIQRNFRTAVRFLKLAAKADIAAAHFDLAVCYETGQGIKKNERTAFRHYLAAALNGDNDSFAEVGRCFYYGIGVSLDRKAAEVCFRRADALNAIVR